jgi:ATPase subunit of ABC transporter with duplicated ATPase domains
LDTDTLSAVEDLLDGWAGTLVVVSHDRYLLERVTDHQLALLGDGRLRGLPGGVDQYLELRETAGAGSAGAKTGPAATSGSVAATAGPSEAEKRDARKEVNRIERQLGKLAQQEEKLHKQMADSSAAMKLDELAGLNAKLKAVEAEREVLEEAWMSAAEVAGD